MERRDFLTKISVAGLGGGLLLNSCETVNDSNDDVNLEADLQLVEDGARFEADGVATYVAAANSGLLTSQAVIDTAILFMNHHKQHLQVLNDILSANNWSIITEDSGSPVPGTENVQTQNDIILLAMDVEFQAANFYFAGATQTLTSPVIRNSFTNILPIEVAHAVTYKTVLGRNPAINSALFEEFVINA